MYIVHVHIHVKPDLVDAFKTVTLENARNSIQEPGVARFDVLQQTEDPTRFVLVEVYHTPEDPAKHKQTEHYNRWREQAEPMMSEPRTRSIYSNVFPSDADW
jgi:quinol monooxygenase YgiN